MSNFRSPLVTVEDGPTFIESADPQEAVDASAAFKAQWQYVHHGTGRDLALYTGVVIAGRTVETDPDALDEWARRGDFDMTEIYRGLFS